MRLLKFSLRMQVNVILLKRVVFFLITGGVFAQAPELIGKITVGELVIQNNSFTRKISRTIDGGNKLFSQGNIAPAPARWMYG